MGLNIQRPPCRVRLICGEHPKGVCTTFMTRLQLVLCFVAVIFCHFCIFLFLYLACLHHLFFVAVTSYCGFIEQSLTTYAYVIHEHFLCNTGHFKKSTDFCFSYLLASKTS